MKNGGGPLGVGGGQKFFRIFLFKRSQKVDRKCVKKILKIRLIFATFSPKTFFRKFLRILKIFVKNHFGHNFFHTCPFDLLLVSLCSPKIGLLGYCIRLKNFTIACLSKNSKTLVMSKKPKIFVVLGLARGVDGVENFI